MDQPEDGVATKVLRRAMVSKVGSAPATVIDDYQPLTLSSDDQSFARPSRTRQC